MEPEEAACRVSQETPRPAPPGEGPTAAGPPGPKEGEQDVGQEPASLGGGCVVVGLACLVPEASEAAIRTGVA